MSRPISPGDGAPPAPHTDALAKSQAGHSSTPHAQDPWLSITGTTRALSPAQYARLMSGPRDAIFGMEPD